MLKKVFLFIIIFLNSNFLSGQNQYSKRELERLQNQTHLCSEPTSSTTTTAKDWYEMEYVEDKNLVLIIKSKIKTVKFFLKK
ncbi:hypothetical protein NZ698_00735 [Chryseobacterium sp. PBS4-4]|uniref:Uncharacterized protein n=1 Tax=Chryseobacterium edaphi TaxID=2976532 RepID=A0ABT2W392_9FLAO|nr:hypothetical protein [Chryseobacterium edaphi]MCU7615707.1 hypothetical protein [Chryseobacterium edaphi]